MLFGLLLALFLLALGTLTAVRQLRALRQLRAERFLPSDDRAYLHGQAVRRLATSGVLVVLALMIGGAYLSGMEARADQLADRPKAADPAAADPGRPADSDPISDADRRFTKIYGAFWIAVLVLVFVAVCAAVHDFWATRTYWMSQYRRIKGEHETKLQRDLAVYRQQKLNARAKGLKPPESPEL